MNRVLYTIFIAILAISCMSSGKEADKSEYMSVLRVIDGDTFRADDGSEKGIVIRLIGVNAPESRNTGRKKVEEFGQQSKEFLNGLLAGQKVRLEFDIDREDQYKRTLAYVYLVDGTFVNAELIKKGYANVMTVPPNVRYAEKFVKLERKARRKNTGLWKIVESDH